MNIEKKENYTLLIPTETSFKDFFTAVETQLEEFPEEHLFLNFLNASFSVSVSELEEFSDLSASIKENGNSFVLISNAVDIDDFEDETLSVVPTLTEAKDVLEMDEIERDLLGL